MLPLLPTVLTGLPFTSGNPCAVHGSSWNFLNNIELKMNVRASRNAESSLKTSLEKRKLETEMKAAMGHCCVQLVCLKLLTGPVAHQQSHNPVVKIQ